VNRNDVTHASTEAQSEEKDSRAPYERPQILKKRAVARVTLFSGSGASGASGLTAT
jgi:hypothetical protein